MILKIILILTFIFNSIKGIEEVSETLSELNDFITISKNIEFTIRTTFESIAFFDSIDKNCLVYIKDERIDGQFYSISSNKDYKISVKLYNQESTSVLQRYLSNFTRIINIQDNSINYLY